LDLHETATDIMRRKLPAEVWGEIQGALYDDSAVALSPGIFKGAQATIELLKKSRVPYFLISRRKDDRLALALLKDRGFWPALFDESNTFFVQSKSEKNMKAQELGIGIYADDQPSVLKEMPAVKHRLLFDPLHSHPDSSGDYERVYSWEEIAGRLERLLYIRAS
jgi:hypothetical protein